MATIVNKPILDGNGRFVLHLVANATIVVVGNNTVSNLATGSDNVARASINKVWWGASNGSYWTVNRGSNNVLVLTETGDLAFEGASLNLYPAANLVFTLNGTGAGYIMLEGQKA